MWSLWLCSRVQHAILSSAGSGSSLSRGGPIPCRDVDSGDSARRAGGPEPTLLAAIQAAVADNPVVWTLGDHPKRNLVHEVTEDAVSVETDESLKKGNPPQRVDAWMIQVAWEWLLAHGC
jgi:hypothetical protein